MTRITDLTEKTTLTGAEFAEISSLSTSVTITATTISALASDNSYNDSGSGFVAAGFAIGDRVNVTGFTGDVANNIFAATVTAVTAGKLTIGGTDGDVIVDDAAGESVTITKWESKRASAGAVGAVGSFSGAMVYRTSTQAITASTTTSVSFTTEEYDVDGWWEIGNPTRLTVPSGVSYVKIKVNILFATASTRIFGLVHKGGAAFVGAPRADFRADSGSSPALCLSSARVSVVPGDYFEVKIFSTATNTINTDNTWFSIEAVT